MALIHSIVISSGLWRRRLGAASLVLGVVALGAWLTTPHLEYRHAMRRLEKVMDDVTDELAMVRETLDERRANLRIMRSELTALRAGLFERDEFGLFVHDLQLVGERAGCTIGVVDLIEEEGASGDAEAEGAPAVRTFRAEVVATGRYERIVELLQRLQEGPRRVRVDSCGLEIADQEGACVELRCGLTIHTMARSDQEATTEGGAEDPRPGPSAVASAPTIWQAHHGDTDSPLRNVALQED